MAKKAYIIMMIQKEFGQRFTVLIQIKDQSKVEEGGGEGRDQ